MTSSSVSNSRSNRPGTEMAFCARHVLDDDDEDAFCARGVDDADDGQDDDVTSVTAPLDEDDSW